MAIIGRYGLGLFCRGVVLVYLVGAASSTPDDATHVSSYKLLCSPAVPHLLSSWWLKVPVPVTTAVVSVPLSYGPS